MENHLFFEGLSLTVDDVQRSVDFYAGVLGLKIDYIKAPAFALIRADGGTIGLLSTATAREEGAELMTLEQKKAIHVEFSTDNLDALYEELKAKGVVVQQPPHDEPWERSMSMLDPDGYSVEFAQGRRGRNMLSDWKKD
jgi:catechol 2,3-dioxygenase-like lactoylglutathione lyase family enzyme